MKSCVEFDLKILLKHTANYICEIQNEVLDSISTDLSGSVSMEIGKWGFEGSTRHSKSKQTFFGFKHRQL